ncbi:MAG: aspartate aminotransferase family protein [Acidobacteriota bacterium]|nr:aspartate aminotransferase family protein [Acidobacteriota bacterium]
MEPKLKPIGEVENVREVLSAKTPRSVELHQRSSKVLAAEVVQTVHMPHPIYIERAQGSRMTDVDGNVYIDLTMGYGPHVLGHAPASVVAAVKTQAEKGMHFGLHNPYQTRLAELITESSASVDEVAFTNSGTEATMNAIRAARAFTGKERVALFDGNYHGIHDTALVAADTKSPRERPTNHPKSAGIPQGTLDLVLMLPYRSAAAFELIRKYRDELAVVVLEPVQSSNPRLDTREWMHELRAVCDECGVLFLLDEVITGFRLAYGGIQERFELGADLVTYGKAIGGGSPIGAVGGRRDIMSVFGAGASVSASSPKRVRIFTGTTFAGNPLTMCAGVAALEQLQARQNEIYPHLESQADRLAAEVNAYLERERIPAQIMNAGSMFHLFFQTDRIESSRDVFGDQARLENEFYLHLLNHGVIVPGIHLAFISAAHTVEDVDAVIAAFIQSFDDLRAAGQIAPQ